MSVIPEIRLGWSAGAAKHSKKLFEQALKIEKDYPQIFTNHIKLKSQDNWFKMVSYYQYATNATPT